MFDLLSNLALLSTSSRSFKASKRFTNIDNQGQKIIRHKKKENRTTKDFQPWSCGKWQELAYNRGSQVRLSNAPTEKKTQIKKKQLAKHLNWFIHLLQRNLAGDAEAVSEEVLHLDNKISRQLGMLYFESDQCSVMNCSFQFQIKWLKIITWSFRSFMKLILVGQSICKLCLGGIWERSSFWRRSKRNTLGPREFGSSGIESGTIP